MLKKEHLAKQIIIKNEITKHIDQERKKGGTNQISNELTI